LALESLRLHLGIKRPVHLLVSDEIDVPATFGVWRPAVIRKRRRVMSRCFSGLMILQHPEFNFQNLWHYLRDIACRSAWR